MSIMSSSNIPGNASNKVLPADKTGLPWEIWQYLLSWLSAADLCRLACVCRTWSNLVLSVDGTRWKQLYMSCSEWRHPFWPLNTHDEPPSWRQAYRDQHISTKFWQLRRQYEATNIVSCSLLFTKIVPRRTIHVGPGLEHECLKTALASISEYDRVVIHPGIYDELFEISSKIPFELIGEGELGSIILVVGIQQVGPAARLSNLVFQAPWFTSFIVMINSGFLQIDRCILEDGMICAQNPATVHIKFCTFRHATVILQHMNVSVIENCEFSQSDSANIIVEGYPKDERNWTFGFLREKTNAVFSQKRSLHRHPASLKATSSITSSILQSSVTGRSIAQSSVGLGWSHSGGAVAPGNHHHHQGSDSVSRDPSCSLEDLPGASFLHPNLLPGRRCIQPTTDAFGGYGCGDILSPDQNESMPNPCLRQQDNLTQGTCCKHRKSLSASTSGAIPEKRGLSQNWDQNETKVLPHRSLSDTKEMKIIKLHGLRSQLSDTHESEDKMFQNYTQLKASGYEHEEVSKRVKYLYNSNGKNDDLSYSATHHHRGDKEETDVVKRKPKQDILEKHVKSPSLSIFTENKENVAVLENIDGEIICGNTKCTSDKNIEGISFSGGNEIDNLASLNKKDKTDSNKKSHNSDGGAKIQVKSKTSTGLICRRKQARRRALREESSDECDGASLKLVNNISSSDHLYTKSKRTDINGANSTSRVFKKESCPAQKDYLYGEECSDSAIQSVKTNSDDLKICKTDSLGDVSYFKATNCTHLSNTSTRSQPCLQSSNEDVNVSCSNDLAANRHMDSPSEAWKDYCLSTAQSTKADFTCHTKVKRSDISGTTAQSEYLNQHSRMLTSCPSQSSNRDITDKDKQSRKIADQHKSQHTLQHLQQPDKITQSLQPEKYGHQQPHQPHNKKKHKDLPASNSQRSQTKPEDPQQLPHNITHLSESQPHNTHNHLSLQYPHCLQQVHLNHVHQRLHHNEDSSNDHRCDLHQADRGQVRDQEPPIHLPIRRSQSQDLLENMSDDDLSILDELGDSDDSSDDDGLNSQDGNDSHDSLSTSSSGSSHASLQYSSSEGGFTSSEESVIMLPHLRELHPHSSLDQSTTSPRGVQAEVASINSDSTRPVPIDVSEDTLMSSYVGQIQGCLIHQCRMNHSKGGLMISLQAHAIVSECDISNVGYGIRCIQNSRVVILKNKIHHCRTSGIFMRLAASGLITGNDIHSNHEAGIDIRKNADPLVQYNQIHHGKRSGVVVLGSGRGQIKKNEIYRNQEAGVYVLYGGNPTISENNIYEGKAAGVAINAGGRSCILDNAISGNQWGGIDIRNGSCPLVAGNSIINGLSDGVVVGLEGKGCIENNFISGNAGCGIWMMAAKHLYIHGNQISNSGHCGIMMLNKSASITDGHLGQLMTNVRDYSTWPESDEGVAHHVPDTNWAVMQYNNVFNNNGHGILVEIEEEVRMLYNAVHGNHGDGVRMSQWAPTLLEGNSITSNCGNGVITSPHHKACLTGNGIYDNGNHGLVCQSGCIVEQNDVAGHTHTSVLVEVGANVQFQDNRICCTSNCETALVGNESAVIVLVNNKFYLRGGSKDFCGAASFSVEHNEILRLPQSLSSTRKSSKGSLNKTECLRDPPPRPHTVPAPPSSIIPTHHMAVVTKLTVPSSDVCKQSSKICAIL